MNTTNGKIAKRSKQKITEALLKVMKIYDFKEITITQLVQEAGLSRKTFYRLFSDKEDVLMFLFGQLSEEFTMQVKAFGTKTILTDHDPLQQYWDVMQLYFDFFEQKKELLLLLQKNNLAGRLFDASYQQAFEIFEYVRTKEVADAYAPQLPYLLAYSIGGMNSMLLKWVENGMEISSGELIKILQVGFRSERL